jgi:hypothetical protein
VPELHLTWITAGAVAAVCVGVGALLTTSLRNGQYGAAVREIGVVVGLFALWMFVGHLVGHHPRGGYHRGVEIWHAEQRLHLADEAALQRPLLGHRTLLEAANYYYAYAHWISVDAVLAWLWWRHRDRYVAARAALVLFTGTCLVLHLVSSAPPRLLAQTHVVDTAARLGQSVYLDSPGLSDHLSAMPSIHVGWATLFAIAAWRTPSRTARALLTAHLALTSYVVVVTGNHFWLDGIVAAAMAVAATVAATHLLRSAGGRRLGVRLAVDQMIERRHFAVRREGPDVGLVVDERLAGLDVGALGRHKHDDLVPAGHDVLDVEAGKLQPGADPLEEPTDVLST